MCAICVRELASTGIAGGSATLSSSAVLCRTEAARLTDSQVRGAVLPKLSGHCSELLCSF